MYEIWRQHNPECRMYMDAKKLMNQKTYIMKHKKIMDTEVEIKRELQEGQRSHLAEREEEKLEHSGTIRDGEQEPNTAATTEEETEIHQQRNQFTNKKKIESTYYQVIQIEIDQDYRNSKICLK